MRYWVTPDDTIDQFCPLELSALTEMFYIHTIRYGSHWPADVSALPEE